MSNQYLVTSLQKAKKQNIQLSVGDKFWYRDEDKPHLVYSITDNGQRIHLKYPYGGTDPYPYSTILALTNDSMWKYEPKISIKLPEELFIL